MSMLNLKELDSIHLSVLAEIGNIGSGNAATALAGLLNTPVDIEVPNICLMDYTKAADYLGGADKTAIGMTVNVKGDMNGVMLQIVEKEFTSRLINTFYEKMSIPLIHWMIWIYPYCAKWQTSQLLLM